MNEKSKQTITFVLKQRTSQQQRFVSLESVTALYERHFWLKVLKIVLNSESSEMWIFPPVLSWLKSKQTLSVYISPEEWK